MYPIEKYRYFHAKTASGQDKIIAVTTYAGKTVRGVAICHPVDSYDEQKGKELAAARCAIKVAKKRLIRASKKKDEANIALTAIEKHFGDMEEYVADAEIEFDECVNHLAEVLSKF